MLEFYHCYILLMCWLSCSALHNNVKTCGELFLTVNAVDNLLELNWNYLTSNCEVSPDSLILYYENPELTTPKLDLESISLDGRPKGYHLTAVKFGNPKFPGNWNEKDKDPILGSHCYPFWVRSVHQDTVIDTVCIKIEPNWMENYGKLKIGEMMIPGTHDSGAWTARHINLVKSYTFTQETNLWEQLVSGIRYFDIRVGLYKNMRPRLWINHGPVRCSKMKQELQHIENFLKKSSKEIVILHFHSFEVPTEFTDENHQDVLELVKEVLGEFILTADGHEYNNGPTLEEIWNQNKRVIVSYNNRYQTTKNSWLWNTVPHRWGDKRTATELYDYLKAVKSNHYHPETPFCALIATLTPNAKYIIQNLNKSLRHMADEVNPRLSVWLRDENWTSDISIITTDFFMGNDVINIAIEENSKRLQSMTVKYS